MATVMVTHWPEVSKEQYEEVRQMVKWETDAPVGAKFHVAWLGADGFHVLDLWNSPADFQRFLEIRLTPAIQKIGVKGEPKVEFAESLSIFAPDV
ncbi:MAG TPA: hypothetical protein VEZ11_09475 [Thermoanaerobaculia bacterium]|nr:hypothetical protein [Thermoanaerobaculia bacterium]